MNHEAGSKRYFPRTLIMITAIILVAAVLGACSSKSANRANESATNSGSSSNPAGSPANSQSSSDKSNLSGKTITVAVESGGSYSELYKELASEFTAKTGINVKFLDVPHENMHERFIIEAIGGTGAIDVYQTDQNWVSEFAQKGFLEPITKLVSDQELSDFAPAALDTVRFNGELYGLPYLVHTPILFYRTDLFKEAGVTKVPTTWDEFRAAAKQLNKGDVSGTIIEGKQHPEPVTHLMDLINQAGGAILDENNNVVFDSPAVMNAFKHMLAIQYEDKTSPPGALGYDNADVHNVFMQGKVAMVLNWPYMYGLANDPAQSKVAGKFSVALQPAGVQQSSAVWSWGYGISSSSKNKEASFEFVKWATSSEVQQKLGKKFINPVARKSALEALKSDKDLTEAELQAISVMSEAVEKGKSATSEPNFPAIQDRLAIALSKIMTKQSPVESEVKAAAADIKGIMEGK